MDIQVENRFVMTKPLFLEGLGCLSRDSYGKTAKKCSLLLLVMWAVLSAVLMLIGGTWMQALAYLAAILFFILWLNVLAPRKHAKKSWEALVNRSVEEPERITRFYEDHLEIDVDGSLKTISYSDIVNIKQTKLLYVLVCRDKMGIMLTKDGFVKGSVEDVEALITAAQIKYAQIKEAEIEDAEFDDEEFDNEEFDDEEFEEE